MQPQRTCDIFCKIVDNYGDIGVCWRLSQQLANEHHLKVRLFIDDCNVASAIIPQLTSTPTFQSINNVTITPWPDQVETLPELVIETFSCGIPPNYAQQVANQQQSARKPILWLNLEYLSAESWVESHHLLPSTHPSLGYQRTFYYPGFTHKTGGLLRESTLKHQQLEWQKPAETNQFWQSLKVLENLNDTTKISIFCYTQADIKSLIESLKDHPKPIAIFLPLSKESTISGQLEDLFGFNSSHQPIEIGNVKLLRIPFLSQRQYDQLLHACDLNFVRGEDSWIRAIWAGKPFVWQPYIQAENTHLLKLKAFLARYCTDANASTALTTLISQAHLSWSNDPATTPCDWSTTLSKLPQWQQLSEHANHYYHAQPSLTAQLVDWLNNPH